MASSDPKNVKRLIAKAEKTKREKAAKDKAKKATLAERFKPLKAEPQRKPTHVLTLIQQALNRKKGK